MDLNYTPGLTLSEKAVSAFPLAIGTSLAFESVFSPMQQPYDPDRRIPDHLDPKLYQTCWINITTLFRNLASAVDKNTFATATPQAIAATLEEEIEVISSLFANEAHGLCKPVFYYSTYEKLTSKNIPGLTFRMPSTDNQKHYDGLLKATIKQMEKHTDQIKRFFDSVEPAQNEKAFILTHQPYDLINFKRFTQLDLLESNTGAIKPRSRWNTKFSPMSGVSFDHLPFHRKILLIMGDKVLIKPMVSSIRKQLIETSINHNWHPMTTLDRVNMTLDLDIRDPYVAAIIHSL